MKTLNKGNNFGYAFFQRASIYSRHFAQCNTVIRVKTLLIASDDVGAASRQTYSS